MNEEFTENIMGFKVTSDHDWWTCEFELPDQDDLYNKIKNFKALVDYELFIEKKEESILIEVCVHLDYGEIAPKDPYIALANACYEIKNNILKGDYGDLELLQAYVDDKHKFERLESPSGIKDIIEKNI